MLLSHLEMSPGVILRAKSLYAVLAVPSRVAVPATPSRSPSTEVEGVWMPICASVPPLPMASSTMEMTKPIMARRPVHCSAKGLKPKMPSSVGRPMLSANCGWEVNKQGRDR